MGLLSEVGAIGGFGGLSSRPTFGHFCLLVL